MTEQGDDEAQLLTVGEVADILRVSKMTVYRLIKRGQITALRIGKSFRIRRGDLEEYLRTTQFDADEQNG